MSRGRCQGQPDAITALVLGTLDGAAEAELRHHLQVCDACRRIYEKTDRVEQLLRAGFDDLRTGAGPAALFPAGEADCPRIPDEPLPSRSPRRFIGRVVPVRFLPRILVAASVLLAATALYHWLAGRSSAAAFADVLRQASRAQTVTFTWTYQVEGQPPRTCRYSAMEPSRLRSDSRDGIVIISDFNQGRQLQIDSRRRTAALVHLTPQKAGLDNYVAWLRSLPADDAHLLRREDLGSKRANVFQIDWPHVQITVWADARTNLPMRIEKVVLPVTGKPVRPAEIILFSSDFQDKPGASQAGRRATPSPDSPGAETPTVCGVRAASPAASSARTMITMTDFSWNADPDESQFAMVAPEGYTFSEMDAAGGLRGEDALVESLRFWAQESDGTFPAEIGQLLEARPKLVARFHKSGPPQQELAEAVRMADVVVHGVLFAQTLGAQDNWHYVDKDVRLGQADRVLCWWKNEDGRTCRVLCGDLRVMDMSPEQLAVRIRSAASQPGMRGLND